MPACPASLRQLRICVLQRAVFHPDFAVLPGHRSICCEIFLATGGNKTINMVSHLDLLDLQNGCLG